MKKIRVKLNTPLLGSTWGRIHKEYYKSNILCKSKIQSQQKEVEQM